ncbi:hypothetical protein Leryth_020157 [Lithospermum erythrorhizon]|nr:hypothetical protein Leryth_020157 [Lithospermum erythrorhizon]
MGLLLLEKNEYNAKCGEISEAVKEAREILNREQGAHRIGIDEMEKREKNLREALDAEKQSVAHLEKMLRETCFEYEQVKLTSDSKLSEATTLITRMRDKSNDIEEKLYAADAKLAEANSKSLELERKSEEIEYRESTLKRERISFNMEREAHEANILRNKEGLQLWEKKLQEREERLCEGRRLVNQMEQKVNDIEKSHNQKERELEEKTKAVDSACLILKEKEEKLNDRLVEVTLQEEKIASIRRNLEAKERELNWRTEKLSSRETMIQNNIDAYKKDLDSKQHEFELELGIKRNFFDDEIRKKVHDLERRETEFSHTEEKLQKREQALDSKSEKFKAKGHEIEVQAKLLKEREKSFKAEKKRLESTNKEIIHEKECLETCKYEIEKLQADISQKKQLIRKETDNLEVARDDKAEHFRLLMELKQEIGRVRNQQELQFKEGEILKNDRQKSKEEWKELDEKIADVSHEMRKLNNEKEMFEKERHSVEEQLKNEKFATEDLKGREYEALRFEKESLAATMRNEQLAFSERAENGHQQLKHEYETLKRELETDMQKKKDEMERVVLERQKAFRKEDEAYLNDMDNLKLSMENEIEEIKSQKQRLRKEKEEVSSSKKMQEDRQSGMQADIGELVGLSNMVKNQRENFIKERSQFLFFVERLKSCRSCSGAVSNHALLNHYVNEANDMEGSLFPIIEDELVDQETSRRSASQIDQTQLHKRESRSSGSRSGTSTLVRCASRLSPINKLSTESSKLLSEELKPSTSLEMNVAIEDGEPSLQIRDESLANSRMGEVSEPSEQSERGRSRRKEASKSKKTTSSRSSHKDEIEIKEGSGRGKVTTEKPAGKSTRKRNRGQTSNTTRDGLQPDDSKEHSESVTTGGHSKRRNTGTSAHQTPENKRYNLRSNKPIGIISEAAVREGGQTVNEQVSVDGGSKEIIPNTEAASVRSLETVKTINEQVSVDGGSKEIIPNTEAASVRPLETSSEDVNQTPIVQVRTYRKVEIQEVSSYKVVESTAPSDSIDEEAPPKSPVLGDSSGGHWYTSSLIWKTACSRYGRRA